jgi:ankyrin repeat protein
MLAADKGVSPIVQQLLKHSPDLLNLRNDEGETAIFIAVASRFAEVVAVLLDAGAEVNIAEADDMTPLSVCQDLGIVRSLISHGADVNAQDSQGDTALHGYCYHWKRDLVSLVLDNGADAAITNNSLYTPLMTACEQNHSEIAEMLLTRSHGAKAGINAQSADGSTALSIAAGAGAIDCVQILIAAGADVNIADNDGIMALGRAEDADVARMLVAAGAIGAPDAGEA